MKRFFNIFILLTLLSSAIPVQASAESKYISLKGSCVYHKIDGGCGKIKETNPDNLLYFDTIEEAKMAGCTQCSNCFGIESIKSENFEFIIPHQQIDESSLEQVVPYASKPSTEKQSSKSNSKSSDLEVALGALIAFVFTPIYGLYELCQHIDKAASTQEKTTSQQIPKESPSKNQLLFRDSGLGEIAKEKEQINISATKISPSYSIQKVTEKRFVTSAQTQAELDAWKRKWKKDDEIGREYERYIGYLCESRGYRVTYYGATKGKSDKGRDLLVKESKNAKEIYVVQCKYRGKDKEIYENTVNQTFGTTEWLARKNPENKYTPVLVTNVPISEDARDCADTVGVKVFEGLPMQDRPLIKCNISKSRDKIYHLPFEQGYDAVQIGGKKGCFYAWTAQEAEEKGFRRSHHNIDQRNS